MGSHVWCHTHTPCYPHRARCMSVQSAAAGKKCMLILSNQALSAPLICWQCADRPAGPARLLRATRLSQTRARTQKSVGPMAGRLRVCGQSSCAWCHLRVFVCVHVHARREMRTGVSCMRHPRVFVYVYTQMHKCAPPTRSHSPNPLPLLTTSSTTKSHPSQRAPLQQPVLRMSGAGASSGGALSPVSEKLAAFLGAQFLPLGLLLAVVVGLSYPAAGVAVGQIPITKYAASGIFLIGGLKLRTGRNRQTHVCCAYMDTFTHLPPCSAVLSPLPSALTVECLNVHGMQMRHARPCATSSLLSLVSSAFCSSPLLWVLGSRAGFL